MCLEIALSALKRAQNTILRGPPPDPAGRSGINTSDPKPWPRLECARMAQTDPPSPWFRQPGILVNHEGLHQAYAVAILQILQDFINI